MAAAIDTPNRYPVVPHKPGVPMSPARRPYLRRDLLRRAAGTGRARPLRALLGRPHHHHQQQRPAL